MAGYDYLGGSGSPAIVALIATPAFFVNPVSAGADIELGRYLAAECMACHRAATATSTIPRIVGMPQDRFTKIIRAYRDKKLANPVMQNIAGRLTDDEIASLALFFSTAKQP